MEILLRQIKGLEDPAAALFTTLARPYLVETAGSEDVDREKFIRSILYRQGERLRWLWLFVSNGRAVGFGHFKINPEQPDVGEILEFYVIPEARHRGIGRAAVHLIHNTLLASAVRIVRLTANPPAEGFWTTCGYSTTDQRVRHMRLMQIRLKPGPSDGLLPPCAPS